MREGYGPSAAAMQVLHAEGASLVVTVDCGASGGAAFDAARAIWAWMWWCWIITGSRVRPEALAHVNPNQPGDQSGLTYLCAAGVAFLFMVGLNRALRESGFYGERGIAEPDLRDYLDLVGLATVCDVVPLIGVNRAFVRQGLGQLSKLSRPGLAALAGVAKAVAAFHHLSSGFCLRPAHQCRRPGRALVAGRRSSEHA